MSAKDIFGKDYFAPPHWGRQTPGERFQKLGHIETLIQALRPDAAECEAIIDALALALKCRYEDPTEVLLRMTLLKGDLERLDNNQQVDASDVLSAYERAVERKSHDDV